MSRLRALLLAAVLVLAVPVGVAHAAAVVSFQTPSAGARVEPGIPVLFAGGAVNGEAGGVVSVELSFDGGATWNEADYQNERWSYVFTPAEPGTVSVIARASTSTETGPQTSPRTLYVGGTGPLAPIQSENILFWPSLPGKPMINEIDDQPVEVGIRTRFDRAGSVTGAIVYRGSYTGPIQLRVWDQNGTLLADQAGLSATYVQRIMFTTPIPVGPSSDYVVSYYTPQGGYAQTENYFTGSVVSAPFMALHDGTEGPGVYHYGLGGGFPADTWNNANYWVQPIFAP